MSSKKLNLDELGNEIFPVYKESEKRFRIRGSIDRAQEPRTKTHFQKELRVHDSANPLWEIPGEE
jgi:hypothetical protein